MSEPLGVDTDWLGVAAVTLVLKWSKIAIKT
jgi:hypothetical protein